MLFIRIGIKQAYSSRHKKEISGYATKIFFLTNLRILLHIIFHHLSQIKGIKKI
jgi:hypothetical protein